MFDDRSNAMMPVHTTRGNKRYRYYVSRPKVLGESGSGSLPRISAGVLEAFLTQALASKLSAMWLAGRPAEEVALNAIAAVTVSEDQILVRAWEAALSSDGLLGDDVLGGNDGVCEIRLNFHMHRKQGAIILEIPGSDLLGVAKIDRALLRAMVQARAWAAQLESGDFASVQALAQGSDYCSNYISRLLPLAYLAPNLSAAILCGSQPGAASLSGLTIATLPAEWSVQRQLFEKLSA